MNINITELSPKVRDLINEMKEIIDWAKASIEAEFSRTVNPWTACFTTVTEAVDNYRTFIERQIDVIDKKEYNKVDEKIEKLKRELWDLRQKYTEKDMQPTDKEKESLFKHLSDIKGMIE